MHQQIAFAEIERWRKQLDRLALDIWENPEGPYREYHACEWTAQLLRDAGPWGQMFPEPLFDGRFRLLQQRIVGERHLKVMVEPVGGGPLLDGIAFNVDTSIWPDNGVREVELAYKLDINEFRGNRSLQIIIDNIWPI